MQDFNYEHSNCFDITLEVTCCKYPLRSTLVEEWYNNKEAMLTYLEAVHRGVKGLITDEKTGLPIANASVKIKGIEKTIYSTDQGEFWRLLKPGDYVMTVSAKGYQTSGPIEISRHRLLVQKTALIKNVALTKIPQEGEF